MGVIQRDPSINPNHTSMTIQTNSRRTPDRAPDPQQLLHYIDGSKKSAAISRRYNRSQLFSMVASCTDHQLPRWPWVPPSPPPGQLFYASVFVFTDSRSKENATFLNETTRRLLEFKKEPEERKVVFPSLLNSHQRYIVHELAESFGLNHLSVGEGKERHIVVRKPKERTEPPPVERKSEERNTPVTGKEDSNLTVEDLVEDFETENKMELLYEEEEREESTEESNAGACNVEKSEVEQTKEKEKEVKSRDSETDEMNLWKCKFCGKRLPPGNHLLHEIHCEKTQAEKKRQSSAGVNKKNRNKAQKQKHC
eukprot:XP_011662390.1 PREDICTED: DNA-binding protein SMUBP-2-like [Strongylocentrotus purpuratus]